MLSSNAIIGMIIALVLNWGSFILISIRAMKNNEFFED